jgi:uncharacterized metal-binding protein
MENVSYILLPCGGVSTAGCLTLAVSREFAEKKSSSVRSIAAVAAACESFDDSDMIHVVVVDGCEKCCVHKILKGKNLTAKYHLILSDLGIEKESNGDIVEGDYELAMDGLEACCADVGGTFPRIAGVLRLSVKYCLYTVFVLSTRFLPPSFAR